MILRTTRFLLLLAACCCCLSLAAQEPRDRLGGPPPHPPVDTAGPGLERVKAVRQAYLTQEMELTETEAAAFFPLFWELERERRQLNREIRLNRPERPGRRLTEAEARERLERRRVVQNQRHELEERYQMRFLEIIPATKLLELERAEREFRQLLIDRVRGRRRDNREHRREGPPRRPRG